jgi:nucleoside 2-deoxyribosyltransferase
MKTIYLCGPINGRSDDDCKGWREDVKSKWTGDCLDPMRRDYRGREHEAIAEIVEFDKLDIDGVDALLVYFDKPSVGTSMEVLYAWQMGKPVVVIDKSDKPLSPWLVYHSTHVVKTIDEALALLKQ